MPRRASIDPADVGPPRWSAARRMHARYVLVGCVGIPPMLREHVFHVIDCGPRRERSMGYMTAEAAVRKFGLSETYMTLSHGMCPDCIVRFESATPASLTRSTRNPREPARLGLVWWLRKPKTFRDIHVTFTDRTRLQGDLEVLQQAGFVVLQHDDGLNWRYVATARGLAECRKRRTQMVLPARARFRGKKEPA